MAIRLSQPNLAKYARLNLDRFEYLRSCQSYAGDPLSDTVKANLKDRDLEIIQLGPVLSADFDSEYQWTEFHEQPKAGKFRLTPQQRAIPLDPQEFRYRGKVRKLKGTEYDLSVLRSGEPVFFPLPRGEKLSTFKTNLLKLAHESYFVSVDASTKIENGEGVVLQLKPTYLERLRNNQANLEEMIVDAEWKRDLSDQETQKLQTRVDSLKAHVERIAADIERIETP